MNIRSAILSATLGLVLTGAASAQVIGYSFRTGDIWVDSQLGQMDDYGRNDRDYFIDDVVTSFGAPRYLVNDLLVTRNFSPGDVYYSCALAYQLRRPCGDVARMYEQDRGQGWGVIAQRLGIKPGSAEFHALKGHVGKSNGKFKSYKSSHGPGHADSQWDNDSGHGSGKADRGPGNSKAKGHGRNDGSDGGSAKSKGSSAKSKGSSGDSGKGKGKDKGGR